MNFKVSDPPWTGCLVYEILNGPPASIFDGPWLETMDHGEILSSLSFAHHHPWLEKMPRVYPRLESSPEDHFSSQPPSSTIFFFLHGRLSIPFASPLLVWSTITTFSEPSAALNTPILLPNPHRRPKMMIENLPQAITTILSVQLSTAHNQRSHHHGPSFGPAHHGPFHPNSLLHATIIATFTTLLFLPIWELLLTTNAAIHLLSWFGWNWEKQGFKF